MIEDLVLFVIGVGVIEVGLDVAQQAWAWAEPTVSNGVDATKGLVNQGVEAAKGLVD